jgi:dynein heavy chain
MTVITMDVHARDAVDRLVTEKHDTPASFAWRSQLVTRWDPVAKTCFVACWDVEFLYQYEYLGNSSRLVVTPLTDRCHVTLTQSLHLKMGAAPAGLKPTNPKTLNPKP